MSCVVTGRLHSVLPAMSQHKKVLFFGDIKDSRFSLLRYFGIKINKIGDQFLIVYNNSNDYIDKVCKIRDNFHRWSTITGVKGD